MPDLELRQIAPDVYAALQPDRGWGWSNSGLVDRGGGLVVDTFWDLPHTRALIDAYADVWKRPASRVVNTHENGDHCWGNQLFAGAEIIGHRRCAEGFDRVQPELLEAMRQATSSEDPAIAWFARAIADWDFTGIELTPPTALVEDRMWLDLDGIPAELVWVGPAHTEGDLIVHLPDQKIVFAGDILFRLCTPVGWEGTYDHWIAALDRIVALAPETIVPGHGPLCGVEGPKEMKAYLEYVRGEAKRFFEAGTPALEAAKRIDLGPYVDWTQPERILFQVERAYRELRGEPHDTPIDTMALFRGMYEIARAREKGG